MSTSKSTSNARAKRTRTSEESPAPDNVSTGLSSPSGSASNAATKRKRPNKASKDCKEIKTNDFDFVVDGVGGKIISRDWDLEVFVGKGNKRTCYRVVRKIVSIACDAWQALLSDPFAEATQASIPLPDDDPYVTELIFQIIHLKWPKVVRKALPFGVLLDMARLIDKYDLITLVGPFYENSLSNMDKSLTTFGQSEWLFITSVFGAQAHFSTLFTYLVHNASIRDGDLLIARPSCDDNLGLGCMPPGSIDASDNALTLKQMRLALLALPGSLKFSKYARAESILAFRRGPVGSKEQPVGLRAASIPAANRPTTLCESALLGSFIQGLVKIDLWPLPKAEDYEQSVATLVTDLRKIELKHDPDKDKDHGSCAVRFHPGQLISAGFETEQLDIGNGRIEYMEQQARKLRTGE